MQQFCYLPAHRSFPCCSFLATDCSLCSCDLVQRESGTRFCSSFSGFVLGSSEHLLGPGAAVSHHRSKLVPADSHSVLGWTIFQAIFCPFSLSHDFLFRLQFSRLSSESCSIFSVGFLPFQGIFLDTLVTSWLEYLSSGICLCLAVILGQWPNISREILRLPFTPPLVAVSSPSPDFWWTPT